MGDMTLLARTRCRIRGWWRSSRQFADRERSAAHGAVASSSRPRPGI